jgi:FKBP-type peptidyl-prolyl cis-trans isomerase
MKKIILFFSLGLMLFGCKKDETYTSPFEGTEDQQIDAYVASKNLTVTFKTVSGLRYILTKPNPSGTLATSGKKITVNYVGKLLNDSIFDQGNFDFTLGAGRVIRGFDVGVAMMKVGEKATLVFPSTLGYGSAGSGSKIPGNVPLIFEIEVVAIN